MNLGSVKVDKKIGIDLDGVVIDHAHNKIVLAREYGYSLRKEDTPSDIIDGKLPASVLKILKNRLYHDSKIAFSAKLTEGIIEILLFLARTAPYYLISRRKDEEIAIGFLKRKKLWPSYFYAENSFFVKSVEEKENVISQLGLDIYMDDQPSILEKLSQVRTRILFDPLKVYNYNEYKDYIIVHSWEGLLRVLKTSL